MDQFSKSLSDCFDENDDLDLETYSRFRCHKDQEADTFYEELAQSCGKRRVSEDLKAVHHSPRRNKRSKKKILLEYTNEHDNLVALKPEQTTWYLLYYTLPALAQPKFHKKFRRHFWLPHAQYMELLQGIEESSKFAHWKSGNKDACGDKASPLPLLVLGSLCYLGRGWTFDCIEEATAISEETHHQFFHAFIEYGSTDLFNRYVITPVTAPHIHGCCGSADATHIMMEMCCHWLRQTHKGPKLHLPSRT
jgi:hypothetical protein